MTTRQQAIEAAISNILFDDGDPDTGSTIIACVGPPVCARTAPTSRTMERCKTCERIFIGVEGNA